MRESEVTDQLKCSFRFLALSADQAARCAAQFGYDRPPRANVQGTGYCVPIELVDESVSDRIRKFLTEETIDASNCDVFLSILTEYDTRIYDVPCLVTKLIRECECKLTVSFTCIIDP
jgi:hypothetical protein